MSRTRSPDRDKAFQIYKEHNGNIDLVEIAKILDRPEGTIRGWKNKDKWSAKLNGTFQNNKERSKRKKGGQPNNKNAVGNNGGPPKKNKNAETHGFFSKYLPDETIGIIEEINIKNPIDILWENIQIQYAAIIRSQRIMYVKNQEDITKHLKKKKDSEMFTEREWEFQYAWDKQATFLKAQSRAMSELRNMIMKYDELCKTEFATEEQKMRIEKTKAQIEKLKGVSDNIEDTSELRKLLLDE